MSKKKIQDKDAYGKGLLAYWNGKKSAKFTVYSDLAEVEKWDISTFFRGFEEMPEAEQLALQRTRGSVLDVGAGAGSQVLWLQEQGHQVTALDISEGAVEVMQARGVKDARLQDFFAMSGEKFDTILLMMNGAGIVQRIDRFPEFFSKAKDLLQEDGRILMDSSNIIYLFMEEDGSALINLNSGYYGEMEYRMDFENFKGMPFDWIFIDFDTLAELAAQHGFSCEKVYEDEHFLYLAELKLAK
ncbi:MAG: class I SAM-dependent methyltransferase [Bacteroidales bacterium]